MEVKQFSQGQFADAFEGSSASDFLKQIAVTPPATPATPAVATPVTPDPIATPTLDPDTDAAKLLQQQTPAEPEPAEGDEEAVKLDPKAAKPAKGRPVERLDVATQSLVADLIKDKKLFGFDDGKIETKKDLQDLLDANFAHRDEQQEKAAFERVFQSFTPAMQMVAQYANQVTNPAELLPLLQNTSNIERFSKLDETNPVHQEMIVREKMRLAGDSDEIIEQEITDLKDRAKLADKAKAYKPALTAFYEKQTQDLFRQKQQEEQEYLQLVQRNDQYIRKILDPEQLDGMKLNKNHKGLVYELLAIPREEYGGGLGIYHVIDDMFQKGQFDRLAKVALLLGDEKSFEDLYGTKIKFAAADSTIRKLNTSGKGGTPTVTDQDPEPQNNNNPTLPRPAARTGFGFSR